MESPFDGMVFYVRDGIKRYISSFEAARKKGIDLSKIDILSAKETRKFRTSYPIIRNIDSINKITNFSEARAYFLRNLKGYGIEFGAATTPSIVPDHCMIDYVDPNRKDEGCNKYYKGESVYVKYFTGLEEMKGIKKNSLDFIIHCHVLEHSPRTILALKIVMKGLKKEGCCLWQSRIWNILLINTGL